MRRGLPGRLNPAFKHGEYGTPLYKSWRHMLQRCGEHSDELHKRCYWDRGITVCDEWREYAAFATWARANGYEDGLSIERKDVTKGYSPDNCTWIPLKEQTRNRSNTVWVEVDGKKLTLKEAAVAAGVPYKVVHKRWRYRGWSLEDALRIPCEGRGANGKTYEKLKKK